MERRGFLKFLGAGVAVAYTATQVPFLKNTDLYIWHIGHHDVVNDAKYHRLEWFNGKKQYGVDFKYDGNDPEELMQRMQAPLHVLFEHIKKHEGSIYGSLPLKLPTAIKAEQMEVPRNIEAKYS